MGYGILGSAQCAGKLLGLLDAFSHDGNATSLSELARHAGLPLSTAHRLVGKLVRWGGARARQRRTVPIGPRMVEIAALCPRGTSPRPAPNRSVPR
jgi:DNA-binding IclR family transcriptional regulator